MSSHALLKSDISLVQDVKSTSSRLRCVADLVNAGFISGDTTPYIALGKRYDIGISDHVRRMIAGSVDPLNDPVGRQYIPNIEELDIQFDEENDPIGDEKYSPVDGIVHRYPDRVLLKISNICAVYCRYCFRREMIGAHTDHLSEHDFDHAIQYIKAHPEIWEVILTGGDPFVLSARRLQKVFDALGAVNYVQVIRIHTRIPIASPVDIRDTIISVLKNSNKAIHIVVHVNHEKEITKQVVDKIVDLREANCSIFSQSVLLRGVNDDASVLEALFRRLICLHVKPYYLHHMDRAKGTAHFRVSLKRGRKIMKDLQGRVSGICLPKYMLDIPDGHGKIPINGDYVQTLDHETYKVEDYQGCTHTYCDKQKEEPKK